MYAKNLYKPHKITVCRDLMYYPLPEADTRELVIELISL